MKVCWKEDTQAGVKRIRKIGNTLKNYAKKTPKCILPTEQAKVHLKLPKNGLFLNSSRPFRFATTS